MAASPPLATRLSTALSLGRRWLLLAMLLTLHAALVSDAGGNFQRVWLMVHFGLFLLWQPFFAAEQELEIFAVVLIVVITVATLYFLSGWMIVAWMSILIGILGGKVFTVRMARRGQFFYLAAFTYLLAMNLLWTVPTLLLPEQAMPGAVAQLARFLLPLILAVLVIVPMSPESEPAQVFDFFYAVLVFQLVVVLVLGSLALMRYTNNQYFPSVALTVFGFGVGLFILAVLWSPRGGFGGLRTYFSRYLLSVGMPFEMWVRRVAELAETEADSRRFLEHALLEVAAFPWMRGGRWKSPDGEGNFGELDGYATRFHYHGLELTFHTAVSLSPALFLHMRLLAQVVGEFYEGKRRESALRQNAYLKAVHETGAHLTHDIKNLLQSLYALTSMAPKEEAGGYAGLLQRQLPQLTRRLHATIEKLRAPEVESADLPVEARAWWADVEKRHAGPGISLEAAIEPGASVPAALFDSLVENFLDNARAKKVGEPGIEVRVALRAQGDEIELSVTDTGSAVPGQVVHSLFRETLEGGGGLGIGLFQAARQARAAGFEIALAANRDGEVRFRVASVKAGTSPHPAPAPTSPG